MQERRTRTETTRTHNRSLTTANNKHAPDARKMAHKSMSGQPDQVENHHRDDQFFGKNIDAKSKMSDRFAKTYGDHSGSEQLDDSEKVSLTGFKIQKTEKDSAETKKSSRQ
jgi:hypothetical protein